MHSNVYNISVYLISLSRRLSSGYNCDFDATVVRLHCDSRATPRPAISVTGVYPFCIRPAALLDCMTCYNFVT